MTASWYGDEHGDLGREGDERLVLRSDRPGAIMHIWSANPRGRLRVYLDGDVTPAVDADLAALLGGRVEPFIAPFAYDTAGGKNLVWPIAWTRSARVTLTGSGVFYTLDYREYAADTSVARYAPTPDAVASCMRRAAADALGGGRGEMPVDTERFDLDATPAPTPHVVRAPAGGGVIRSLRLHATTTDERALRETALAVSFDGERTVYVPLTGLFLRTARELPVTSLPVYRVSDGVVLRLPMPMRSEASFSLVDLGGGAVRVGVSLAMEARAFDDDTLYLHAAFMGRHEPDVSQGPSALRLLTVRGAGRYVGTLLDVANSDRDWWGEGDPRFSVDDDPPEALRGTGTEDFFNYAFCSTRRFSHPFNGQLRANGAGSAGFVSLYRFHIADDVPFRASLAFDLEVLLWATTHRQASLGVTGATFFYARPGASVDLAPLDAGSAAPLTLREGVQFDRAGVYECR